MPFALTTFKFDDPPRPDVPGVVISLGKPLPLSEPGFVVLRKAGWMPVELPLSIPVDPDASTGATVRIGEGGIRFLTRTKVNGGVIDDDPIGRMIRAPDGWWEALAEHNDRCAIVVVDRIDLRISDNRAVMASIREATARGAALSTIAKVEHVYP